MKLWVYAEALVSNQSTDAWDGVADAPLSGAMEKTIAEGVD